MWRMPAQRATGAAAEQPCDRDDPDEDRQQAIQPPQQEAQHLCPPPTTGGSRDRGARRHGTTECAGAPLEEACRGRMTRAKASRRLEYE